MKKKLTSFMTSSGRCWDKRKRRWVNQTSSRWDASIKLDTLRSAAEKLGHFSSNWTLHFFFVNAPKIFYTTTGRTEMAGKKSYWYPWIINQYTITNSLIYINKLKKEMRNAYLLNFNSGWSLWEVSNCSIVKKLWKNSWNEETRCFIGKKELL